MNVILIRRPKSFVCCILILLISQIDLLNGQNPDFQIKFQKEISSSADVGSHKSFLTNALNLILGNTDLSLQRPFGLSATANDGLLIVDQQLQTIVQIDTLQHHFRVWDSVQLPSISGICTLPDGRILLSDSKTNNLYQLQQERSGRRNFNLQASLIRPSGIAYQMKDQTVWVCETGAHRISIFDLQGRLLKRIGKRGERSGEFNFPTFIWIDRQGMVFVVDAMNFRVQIFNARGAFISAFGQAGDATGFFARPKGIATDSFGHIYVVDALFHTVQVFDAQGKFLDHFGEQGREPGQFWLPSGIYIDPQNVIYVADTFNQRIQIFSLERKKIELAH